MTTIVKDENVQIEKLPLGPFGTNAYIITCVDTRESVLIDAPAEADTIMKNLEGTSVKYILMTHHHFDHTGALTELHSKLGVPLAAHDADSGRLPDKPDMSLNDGDIIKLGNLEIEVIHTPGHTPGSVCFRTGKYLISGDTIFAAGPGKTGRPADLQQIIESLKAKIFTLPDDTQIFPGHGDATVLKKEKEEFAVFESKPHSPDLCGDVVWLTS